MIAATLSGSPNYFTPNHDADSIEVFATLEDALVALIERHHSNGRTYCPITYLNGTTESVLFPLFDEGSRFECYAVAGELVQSIASEDQVLDTLTDVHSGCWTWALELAGFGMDLHVKVTANR